MRRRFFKLGPRDHLDVWKSTFQAYKASWKPPEQFFQNERVRLNSKGKKEKKTFFFCF
jgi:hypothetical protein